MQMSTRSNPVRTIVEGSSSQNNVSFIVISYKMYNYRNMSLEIEECSSIADL